MRWYGRYALSYNDLKEIAAERGLFVERSTICRWVQEYSTALKRRIKPHLKSTCDFWKADETYIMALSLSRYRQWCQYFETAQRAIDGMEIMRAVQKGN